MDLVAAGGTVASTLPPLTGRMAGGATIAATANSWRSLAAPRRGSSGAQTRGGDIVRHLPVGDAALPPLLAFHAL